MTESLSSVNLRNILSINVFRIETEDIEKEILSKIPAAKHYIVYPETTQGGIIRVMPCDARLARGGGHIGKWC